MSLDNTKKINRVVVNGEDMQVVGVPTLQEKSVTPSTNPQSVTADEGYDGLSQVNIDAVQTEQRTFTQNGEYSATSGKFINKVVVNVADIPAVLQEKSVTPTKSLQEVTPDVSYEGLSKVSVNPIPSEYIVPSGTKTITTNGTHTVTEYANVEVTVAGIQPSGTIEITENNKTYDVTNYASASVNVPTLEGSPIEVATDTDMTNALTQGNLGKVYKFTGTSSTYETGAIYIISEV